MKPPNDSIPPRWIGWCALAITALGCLQFVGYALQLDRLRGLGAAIGFAPYTKVFCDVDGFETFAARFALSYELPDGRIGELPVTPELYQQLAGPYNRRNVYGAALSYAPRLPEPIWQSVFCYGFKGPLRREFGIPPEASNLTLVIESKTRGRPDSWRFTPVCSE